MEQHWTHHEQIFNGLRFHYVSQGDGPLVLLLHGFPEFWYSWRYQLPALAAAGFRVVAPDMRGYNLSEKPGGIDAYDMNCLVADVAAMLRELSGTEGGYLVGHDWGGAIAWSVAARHPDLVRRLVILNAPHGARLLEVLREVPRQRLQSIYIALFQIPWLPERMLSAFGGAAIERMIRGSGAHAATFTQEDGRRYREAFTQPGAPTATLNYYRSYVRRILGRRRSASASKGTISAPTLLLWGMNDVALHNANAERDKLARWVPHLTVEPLPASHWVMMDAPEQVNEKITAFLKDPL